MPLISGPCGPPPPACIPADPISLSQPGLAWGPWPKAQLGEGPGRGRAGLTTSALGCRPLVSESPQGRAGNLQAWPGLARGFCLFDSLFCSLTLPCLDQGGRLQLRGWFFPSTPGKITAEPAPPPPGSILSACLSFPKMTALEVAYWSGTEENPRTESRWHCATEILPTRPQGSSRGQEGNTLIVNPQPHQPMAQNQVTLVLLSLWAVCTGAPGL